LYSSARPTLPTRERATCCVSSHNSSTRESARTAQIAR
jgi:hypothetical protein